MKSLKKLKEKVCWIRKETIRLHKLAPETRVASCLSAVEIFAVFYYGNILRFDAKNPGWEQRDRFIISKGHGAVSLYPVLADLGFFNKKELERIGRSDSFLGVIPDTAVPGFETTNGALGHGLGVACGVALALKRKKINRKVYVLSGDGELNEGAVWEAVMFAAFHKLGNLILIVDNNKISMLGYQKDILGLEPLDAKFAAFGWKPRQVDGHDVKKLRSVLSSIKKDSSCKPKVLIADTCKGKGVPGLENDPLCHIKVLKADEIEALL